MSTKTKPAPVEPTNQMLEYWKNMTPEQQIAFHAKCEADDSQLAKKARAEKAASLKEMMDTVGFHPLPLSMDDMSLYNITAKVLQVVEAEGYKVAVTWTVCKSGPDTDSVPHVSHSYNFQQHVRGNRHCGFAAAEVDMALVYKGYREEGKEKLEKLHSENFSLHQYLDPSQRRGNKKAQAAHQRAEKAEAALSSF